MAWLQIMGKKDPIVWSAKCKAIFVELKTHLTQAPLLQPWHEYHLTWLNTDVLDFAISEEVKQLTDDGQWHLVAYESKILTIPKYNYPAQEHELLAILHC